MSPLHVLGVRGAELHVFHMFSEQPALVLALDSPPGHEPLLGARAQGDRLIAFDAFGRLMVISLIHCVLLRELRVS